ncbi:hypothetical protein GEO20_19855 [Rhodococcus erythropolis]|uniref:hypothetical protein n=1 Tax=Rhodococcus erythropolis TaxID=1833 RepID=UPI0012923032|nr:hypothetical protein [Rhodococcus erythropolis]MQP34195.1 hypothetical protein [Rhodococcus erythropolis]
MMIVDEATRVVRGVADATTTVAGAVGGGVIGGVTGGIRGTTEGVRDGIRAGSSSTPTAVLTMAAVGAAGLVEWPVLLAVGGTALVLHEWDRKSARPDRAVKAVGRATKTEPAKKESSGNSHKAASRSQDRTHSSSHTRSTS